MPRSIWWKTSVFPASHPAVLDVRHPEAVATYLSAHPVDAIISSLPYFCNPTVATLALKHGCHYFDLTEDVEVTESDPDDGRRRDACLHAAMWPGALASSASSRTTS